MSYRWDTICNGWTDGWTDGAILICLPKFLRGIKIFLPKRDINNDCMYFINIFHFSAHGLWSLSVTRERPNPKVIDNQSLKCSASLDRSLRKNGLCRDVINCLKDQSPSYDFWVGRTSNPSPFIYTRRKSFKLLLKSQTAANCTCRSVYLLTNKNQFWPGTCIYYTLMTVRKNQLSLNAARVV